MKIYLMAITLVLGISFTAVAGAQDESAESPTSTGEATTSEQVGVTESAGESPVTTAEAGTSESGTESVGSGESPVPTAEATVTEGDLSGESIQDEPVLEEAETEEGVSGEVEEKKPQPLPM